ncbi:hypothetical protein [Corynebacterium halotolerans]|uniref:Uncharacterized protein n=1 Tax=Corynebacterium halotolerans YIM 70093 = DSM 44683 TaxID=1121362 RepID=M1MU80_9CORY|nr:hypothetical protein [Corynebacterium halotolerans]AGF71284.1 hypothetical protein A605_01350 [Corynebacterium halotolerans YIM 70093 = DSM 44683]
MNTPNNPDDHPADGDESGDRSGAHRASAGKEHHHAGQPPYYQVPQTSGVDRPRKRPVHVGRMGSRWYSWWVMLIPAVAVVLMFVFIILAVT